MNWIKSKIVMLPTNDEINDHILVVTIQHSHLTKQKKDNPWKGINYYLYFTTDEEIKKGDWYITKRNEILKSEFNRGKCEARKIIATTDPKLCQLITKAQYEEIRISRNKIRDLYESSMQRNTYHDQIKKLDIQLSSYEKGLPQPSQDFIKEYCNAGGIDEVMVEYNQYIPDLCMHECKKRNYPCSKNNVCVEYKLKTNPDNTVNIRI